MNKVCETGPPVYRPYPRRLESLIICRCHYKDSTFSSVIFKTLSVGLARIRTRDLPLSRPWVGVCMSLALSLHYFQCNRINLFFISYCTS